MGTLQDAKDYFKGDDVPKVHPFQDVQKTNTFNDKYNDVQTKENQFGYSSDGTVKNDNEDYKKIKKKK